MNCDELAAAVRRSPLVGWTCRADGEFLRIETPLRYPDGGTVELYVEPKDGMFIVTDFGEAFRFLESTGMDPLRSPVRERMIALAAKLGSATIDQGAIEIVVTDLGEVFPTLTRLGQVVTRVSDLALHSRGIFANTFSDEVEDYLRERTQGIEIKRRETVQGASEAHEFDLVTRSVRKGVSAIEALSAVSGTGANSETAFSIKKFADIEALGQNAPQRIVVLDDSADVWITPLRQQLARFAHVVEWEKRDVLPSML